LSNIYYNKDYSYINFLSLREIDDKKFEERKNQFHHKALWCTLNPKFWKTSTIKSLIINICWDEFCLQLL